MVIQARKQKSSKTWLIVLVIIVLMAGSGFTGFIIGQKGEDNGPTIDTSFFTFREFPDEFNFSIMKEVWKFINSDYVDKEEIDNQEMFYSVMAGMVAGLGDPYSVFFDPEQTKEFNEDINGKFEGIGAEIAIKDDRLTIVAPLPDSPAEKAGIQAGDVIFSIDGTDTADMTLREAVKLIRGEKGTIVKLLIFREGQDPFEVEITRDVIYIESVKYEIKDGNIGYIEISSFNSDTATIFKQAILEMQAKNVNGIVLDLRNNPGGLLEMAIHIASAWVENSNVVVVEKFGDGTQVDYEAEGTSDFKDMPTVVLINGGSASGSEIVAGALKDYNKATLVGEKTFGKGSVQTLQPLSDGSSVKLTIAKWLTPNGLSISDEGVTPDEEIEYTKEDFEAGTDPQLDRAMAILKGEQE